MVELGLDYRLKDRPGLPVSVGLHILLLGWGLLWLPASKPLEPPPVEALPVEIVSEIQAAAAGSVSAPDKGKPAPEKFTPAKANPDSVKPGAAEKDMETPPTPPVAKPPMQASNDAPPPPPRPEPPKETPKEPQKPPEPEKPPQKPPEKPPEKPVEAKPTPQDEKALSKLVDHDADAPPPPQKPAKAEAKAESKPPPKPAGKPPEKPATKKSDADPLAAAEKLLDPSAKAGSGKTATAKATKFDADKLDAMLNRQSASGGGSRAQLQDSSLGAASGAPSAMLSAGEVNALKRQIRACWNIPVAAKPGDDLKVRLSFSLNPDGSLAGQPQVLQAPRGDLSQVAAEAAVRAVAQCGPYTLPADKYAAWKQNTINFDPSQFQ